MPIDDAQRLACLTDSVRSFEALLAEVDLKTQVPSCPGWTVQDLVGHLGAIHRWATLTVRTGRPGDSLPSPPDSRVLVDWFTEGAADLLLALRDAVPGRECWTFGPQPRTVDFWIRRQALETALHLWDFSSAVGAPSPIDAALGSDGVDEVTSIMFPRQVQLGLADPLPVVVELVCLDSGQRSRLGSDSGSLDEPAAVTVTAPAGDLLLLLWRRLRLDSPGIVVAGDSESAERVFAAALTP